MNAKGFAHPMVKNYLPKLIAHARIAISGDKMVYRSAGIGCDEVGSYLSSTDIHSWK